MRLVDSRRLRGPNLQTGGPAAVAEVLLEPGEAPREAAAAWRVEAARMVKALGWKAGPKNLVARHYPGGVVFAIEAPVDALMEATDVNDWAIERASDRLAKRRLESFALAARGIAARVKRHANPALVALRDAARRRDAAFLWDDEDVTLGMAARSVTYRIDRLPAPKDVPWGRLGRIPVALVTGTNGKTTTARLVARMAKLAGHAPGCTSTDGITLDERLVLEGDFTGAEGARTVLRNPDVSLAILETARGGILRRGLAIDACDAALVTNVSSDHLGEFGVTDLPTMARAKAVVGTVVRPKGRVVLNGEDPLLVALADSFPARPVLFFASSDGGKSPVLTSRVAKGQTVFAVRRGQFVRVSRRGETRLAKVDDAPLTFHGAAPHNVANCLAAAALAWSLGIPDAAVREALRSFGSQASDNPGRGEVVTLPGGVRLLLDFGHNAAGLTDLFALARSLLSPGASVVSAHTQPGDRTKDDTAALARAIHRGGSRAVALWESEDYLRGRAPGDVARAIGEALAAAGMAPGKIEAVASEVEAVDRSVAAARPGDLVVVAPHIDREGVAAWVRERRASAGKPGPGDASA